MSIRRWRPGRSATVLDSFWRTWTARYYDAGGGARRTRRHPHTTIDPIGKRPQLIVDLQTMSAVKNSPFEAGGGDGRFDSRWTKHNIIPDTCRLQLTVRIYTDKVRSKIHEAIQRKRKPSRRCRGSGAAYRVLDATPATRQ